MKTLSRTVVLLLAVGFVGFVTPPVAAQSSANHKLTESAFDQGGNMGSTGALVSDFHRLTMSALGGPAAGWTLLASASHRVQGGFVSGYPPPGEIVDLRFVAPRTLGWTHEPSIGSYQLYRGSIPSSGGPFVSCLQGGLIEATAVDLTSPSPGQAWGYLATARNRLGEEGTAGQDSSGVSRSLVANCP